MTKSLMVLGLALQIGTSTAPAAKPTTGPIVTKCCSEGNVAFGRTTRASSEEVSKKNFARHAVDGDPRTRWCAANGQSGQTWQVELGKQRPGKHKNGSGSNPSVVTDGNLLFTYYKSGTLAALDFSGKIKWKPNLQKSYGEDSLWWDLGTSPVLAGGNVIVAVMHEGNSYVVAFKQEDGSVAWKVDRNFACEKETHQSYSTPTVLGDKLIIWGADHITGHKVGDGSTIWTSSGLNPENKAYWRMIASQSISDGVCVVPYGRAGYLAGIKIGGTGDITTSNRLWTKNGIGSDVPTPVTVNGKVYHLSDKGQITLLDIQTGNVAGEFQIQKGRGKFYASPTLANGHLYCLREEGDVYVVEVAPSGMQLVSQATFDDRFAAAPVLVDGHLFLRGVKTLYCFGK